MNPFELLAQLQEAVPNTHESKRALEDREYAQLKTLMDVGYRLPDQLGWYVETHEEMLREAGTDPIPATQSLTDYVILKRTKHVIDETVADRTTFAASDKIVLGSIESLNINASIYPVNDVPEYLVVLNRGVLGAISSISNVIAYVADIDDRLWIRGVLSERVSEARECFIDIICKYVLGLSGENYKKIPLAWDTPRELLWILLHQETEMFVVGHEYGHFLCGHFGPPQPVRPAHGAGQTRETRMFQWAQEYEADIAGYDLCVLTWQRLGGNNALGIEAGWRGVNLFFEIIHLFNRVFDIDRRLIPESSHPSPTLRINRLMAYTDSKVRQVDFMGHLMDVRYGLANCLAALWHQCEDDVKAVVEASTEDLEHRRGQLLGS